MERPRTPPGRRRCRRAFLAILAGVLVASGVPRPARAGGEDALVIPRALVVPRCDGAIATGEWDDAVEAPLAAPLTAPEAKGPDEVARRDVVAFRAKWDDDALYLALKGWEPPTQAQEALARHLAGDDGVERPADTAALVEAWRIRLDPRPRGEGAIDARAMPGRFELRFFVAWCPPGVAQSPFVVQAEAGYLGHDLPRGRRAEAWTPPGLSAGAHADPGLTLELVLPFDELNARHGVIAGDARVAGARLERVGAPAPGETWALSVERRYTRTLAATWGGIEGYPGSFGARVGRVRFAAEPVAGAEALVAGGPYRPARTAASGEDRDRQATEGGSRWPPEGFTTDVRAALARASAERRLVLMLFSTPEWEERRPQRDIWRLPPFRALADRFVFVVLDPAAPVVPGLPVPSRRALPQVVVLTPGGREAGRVDGPLGARAVHEALVGIARRQEP